MLIAALSLGLFSSVHAADYYLTVAGAGAKTGADWANAYDMSSLGTVVNTTMQPGDTLYVGGPESSGAATYGDKRLTITSSGTSTAQKSLIGVDRGYGLPQFIGTQSTRSYTTITFADTVGYWTIKDLYIAHRDYGIATAGAGHPGIVIDGVTVHDTRSACYSFTDCDGIVVQNCRAERYTALGFMCNNSCDWVTFRNCVADCTGTGSYDDTAWKSTVNSPVGFNFNVKNGTGAPNTDILLEDCESLNNDEDTATVGDYEQGDGFKTEDGNVGITFVRCLSHANQDGAFDLKGTNQSLQDCVAVNNLRYGFKIWYDGTLTNCVAVNNSARQLTMAATTTGHTIHANYCTFHCASTSQAGVVIETAGNTAALSQCIISFADNAGTYSGGSGTFSSDGTVVKLAHTSNTANAPMYVNPTVPWDGSGTDFDNQTYGTTKGYNSWDGFVGQDIGSVGIAGGMAKSGPVFTIQASGADIWGTSDQFYYAYQILQGDGEVTARVQSLVNTNAAAKAGLMIRETLATNSKYTAAFVTGANGARFHYRASTGGSAVSVGSGPGAPQWVRLVRAGNTFTGYCSSDGVTWTQLGTATVSMAQTVYVGMAVTSHNNAALTTAVIDSFLLQ